MNDGVVVLHGIFRTNRSMSGLSKFLEKSGFIVLNLDYPSTKYSIENLADIIAPQIQKFAEKTSGKLHFVGYSMGGLLIRAYLKNHQPNNLGKIVMLGTPNKGSEVADFLQNFWLYKKLYGPAGQQLITNQTVFEKIFNSLEGLEVGIIAGNKPIDPISSRIIGKPNDGKVSIESTSIKDVKDKVLVPCSHTFFPSNRKVWLQVLSFLQTGLFKH